MTKAVVMAGGEGTRLRPLTVNRPKPMVPVVNRPVMEHIVGLLKQHGIEEIIATLQYLPDVIRDYFGDGSEFGVQMQYSVEVAPLGTAGSVKQIGKELNNTFIVISGDSLTDLNLTELVRFHKSKGSVATLALTRVENPLEFGVVIADGQGRIVRFLEKPSWSEVFSDTINTGIYVLEPEVLDLMEPDQVYDWSKDIFPKLLAAGRPMFGYISRDYWCDIGTIQQCLQANEDCLAGRVKVRMPGEEIRRGLWIGRGVEIDPTADITVPVVIGDGAVIRRGSRVGEFTCIGPNTIIDTNAEVKRTVTMSQVYIGRSADVRASWISKGASLGERSSIGQGVVIGDESLVGEGAILKPGVKLWPNKIIEAGAQVNATIVWGSRQSKAVFGAGGVSGLGNIEITPQLTVRLGEAFGSIFSRHDSVCVSRDAYPASVMLKRAFMAGLASTGVRVFNLETSPLPLTRHAVATLGAKGGAFIQANPSSPGGVTIKFMDSKGADIDTNTERKIDTLLVREDTRKVPAEDVGRVNYPSKVLDFYRTGFLERIDVQAIRKRQFRLVLDYGHGAAGQLMPSILGELGCQEMSLNSSLDVRRLSQTREDLDESLASLGAVVSSIKADLGVRFDASGERIYLVDNHGNALDGQRALILLGGLILEGRSGSSIAVPVTTSSAIEQITGERNMVQRLKTGVRALMQAATSRKILFAGDESGAYVFPDFHAGVDGLFATAKLLELLALSGRPMDRLVALLPPTDVAHAMVYCPSEAKGRVMRQLIETTAEKLVQLIDGVKVIEGDHWIALIPDPIQPVFHLYAEPGAGAESMMEEYRGLIQGIVTTAAAEQEALAHKEVSTL